MKWDAFVKSHFSVDFAFRFRYFHLKIVKTRLKKVVKLTIIFFISLAPGIDARREFCNVFELPKGGIRNSKWNSANLLLGVFVFCTSLPLRYSVNFRKYEWKLLLNFLVYFVGAESHSIAPMDFQFVLSIHDIFHEKCSPFTCFNVNI